ncbi:hypothetical protein NFI96_000493 [Prochilodus magdalenae]|nr:hypothetical protein NFI96_000493 [Prochilodus magdalenae]
MSFIAQTTFTYDLQDTIQKLRDENAYLHHRLENLTQALRDLRKLIVDHSKDHEFAETSVGHDSDQLHAWNEWIRKVFSALPQDGVGVLNSPLMLHCAVYDSGLQRVLPVKWEKDSGDLGIGVHQMANGSLFFAQLQEEDLGGYVCSAKKGSKQIRSIVRVSKAYLDNIFFSPQSQSANEGQDVFFQCVSGDSSPPAHISWLKNGRALTKGTQIQGQYGGGSQKKTSGTLHLVNTTKADQGIYVCVTHNPLLNISKESSVATLTVHGFSTGLEIVRIPENLTVPAETEAVLHCMVQGFPTPVVQWFKDDQMVQNATLYISSVRIYDEGFYTCAASNSVGQDKKTATLRISDNGTLYISRAQQSDAGEYYCTAENHMGQDSRKAFITVLSADPGEDVVSAVPDPKLEKPTNSTINNNFKLSKDTEDPIHQLAKTTTVDVYMKDYPTHSTSALTPYIAGIYDDVNIKETQTNKPTGPDSKLLKTNTENKQPRNTPTNLITQQPEQPTLDPGPKAKPQSAYTQSSEEISQVPEQHSNSNQGQSSPSSLAQALDSLNLTTGVAAFNIKSITTTAPLEVFQNWSQPTEQLGATKASQTNNTELVETQKKNTSKAPMRTTDNNGREKKKSQSWLPVLEKHDIPIVVGVGVSLAFIFITMAFYSLFRKNDPEAKPTGRAALRGLGGPCRHGERLAIERTYDNKAFEDDNMVAVIEQSPNTSETRAHPPASSPSTLLMEPSYDDVQEEVQPIQDLPVIVETHPEPSEEEQLETSFEESKVAPSPLSDIQLQCMEDWRSRDFGQCHDAPSPPPPNPPASQEEGLRSSLTLQTSEPCSTPVHHSINISHGSSPLLLSHCVSLGMTSVAVDVHFYPSSTSTSGGPVGSSTFGPLGPQSSSRLERNQTASSVHRGK